MKYFGRLILALVALLSVYFVWQSLLFRGAAGLGETWLYLLIPALLVTTIGMPALNRVPVALYVLSWIGIYFLVERLDGQLLTRVELGQAYAVVVDTAVVAVASFLVYRLGRALGDFKQSVERVTLAETGTQIPQARNIKAALETEIDRSRRHEHDFTAIIIQWQPKANSISVRTMVEEIQTAMSERFLSASLGGIIRSHTRRTDIVVQETAPNRLIVFCPSTDAFTSAVLAERIQKLASKELHAEVRYGIGSLEKGAGTLEQVVHQATSSLAATGMVPRRTELNQAVPPQLRGLDD